MDVVNLQLDLASAAFALLVGKVAPDDSLPLLRYFFICEQIHTRLPFEVVAEGVFVHDLDVKDAVPLRDLEDEGLVPDGVEIVLLVGSLDGVVANSKHHKRVTEAVQVHGNEVARLNHVHRQHGLVLTCPVSLLLLVLLPVLLAVLHHRVVLPLVVQDALADHIQLVAQEHLLLQVLCHEFFNRHRLVVVLVQVVEDFLSQVPVEVAFGVFFAQRVVQLVESHDSVAVAVQLREFFPQTRLVFVELPLLFDLVLSLYVRKPVFKPPIRVLHPSLGSAKVPSARTRTTVVLPP